MRVDESEDIESFALVECRCLRGEMPHKAGNTRKVYEAQGETSDCGYSKTASAYPDTVAGGVQLKRPNMGPAASGAVE